MDGGGWYAANTTREPKRVCTLRRAREKGEKDIERCIDSPASRVMSPPVFAFGFDADKYASCGAALRIDRGTVRCIRVGAAAAALVYLY